MKRRLAPLALACLAPLLLGADKPVLVPDISARQVQIRYSFTGAQLLLFGAVVYPGGRPPPRRTLRSCIRGAFARPRLGCGRRIPPPFLRPGMHERLS
jgi:hypothetical protein